MRISWLVIGLVAAAAGCGTKLETGYEPVKLGSMTPTQRRGLYSPNFTPEARAAQADQRDNDNSTTFRPHPGGAY